MLLLKSLEHVLGSVDEAGLVRPLSPVTFIPPFEFITLRLAYV